MEKYYDLIRNDAKKCLDFSELSREDKMKYMELEKMSSSEIFSFREYYPINGDIYAWVNNSGNWNSDDIEYAIEFLEVDPYYYRTGYLKERIIQRLKGQSLNNEDIERILNVVLYYLNIPIRREYRYFRSFAIQFGTEGFKSQIFQYLESIEDTSSDKYKRVFQLHQLLHSVSSP